MSQKQQEKSFEKVAEFGTDEASSLHLSIEDMSIERKKLFSQVRRPVEETGWHYFHQIGK